MNYSTTIGLPGFAIASADAAVTPVNCRQQTAAVRPSRDGVLHTAPLTYHQERLWFIDEFERNRVYSGSPTYHNIPILLRIDGETNRAALESALQSLICSHEALRTKIQQGEQRVYAVEPLPLAVLDAGGLDENQVVTLALCRCRTPFLLENDYLFRADLWRMAEDRMLLALTVHHLVADLTSTQILAEQLVEFYRAEVTGANTGGSGAAAGFSAYARWHRSLPGSTFDPLLPFWKWQLQGELPALELPYIRGRHHIHIYSSAVRQFALDRELISVMVELAARAQVDLSDAIFAGFLVALYACSRQKEIIAGISHPNRDRDTEQMVGPIANLLAVRFRPDETWTFSELLRHVHKNVHQARNYGGLPFDLLVQRLNPPKDMSRTALFDVLYRLLEDEPHVWMVPNAVIRRIETFVGYGKYDLTLTLRHRNHIASGYLEFNRELFHESFIEDFLVILESVLRTAAADVRTVVSRLAALPTVLAQRQVELLRAQAGVEAQFSTLNEAFDAICARCPDRIVIVFEGTHFSYRSIGDCALRVARELLRAGVRPGTPVIVFLDRSPAAIGAMLGVLQAGAYYVPVDPQHPPLRMAMLVEDSEAAYVITSAALRKKLAEHMPGRLTHVIELEEISRLPAGPLAARSRPEDVAYSIYTSGSTGRPKGCLVQHRNVVQLVLSQAATFAFSEEDVWAWSHSMSFDFSVWEIFGSILHGARGVMLSEDAVRDLDMVRDNLAEEQITILNQTPAAGVRLTEHLMADAAATPSLRYLIFGGDVLTPKKLEPWSALNPHVAIVNMYGITETTVHVTYKALDSAEIAQDSRSVGRALPNAANYIVANDYSLLPAGTLGEIGVTGDGVSLGYWKRPGLTAERFVPDSFGERPGARMYVSGDLGRLLPNGEIDFHGRRDNQVKIRGYRIELGEIEKVLLDHGDVHEAAVVVRDDGMGNRMLAAFVTPREREIDPGVLRLHLQERLPAPMNPSLIKPLRALPRSATGKIDRKALTELALQRDEQTVGYLTPKNETESILARIWEEVLGRSPIGIADNFFEIGGDSILSIQICTRARRAGLALAPKLLFEHPTIGELAPKLERTSAQPISGKLIREAPLLPVQAWFFAQKHSHPNHFNQSAWFTLRKGVTAEDLHEAFQFLRQRHVALRTVFVEENGSVFQRESDVSPRFHFSQLSFAGESDEERRREIKAAADELQRGLNVHTGPVCGALMVEPASGESARLLIVLHHLIADSISWRILVEDLDLFLDHRLKPEPLNFTPASSLLEYAYHFSEGAASRNQTVPSSGVGVVATAANTFANYQEVEITFDESSTTQIANALIRERLGWEEALIAGAAQAALACGGGEAQEIFFEGHGRESNSGGYDPSQAIGWFMKLYGIRLGPMRGSGVLYAREAKVKVAQAKTQPDLFQQWRQQTAADGRGELLQPGICVNFLGQFDALLRTAKWLSLAEGEACAEIAPENRRFHLIDVIALIVSGKLRVRWGYCAALHQRTTIEQLAASFSHFLRALPSIADFDLQPNSPAENAPCYPLAPGQLGLLYRALANPDAPPEYLIGWLLKFDGELKVDLFRRSWEILLQRHEGLRSCFAWGGADGPTQRFAEKVHLPFTVLDWRALQPRHIQTQMEARMREKATRAFDLGKAPLLWLELIQSGDREWYVLHHIHHAILDGWSLAILRDELIQIYVSLRSGHDPKLKPAGQFRDYLSFLSRQDYGTAREFWKSRMHGVKPCSLPSASPAHEPSQAIVKSVSLEAVHHALDRNRGWALWAGQHQLTMNTVVQGLWSLVIGVISGCSKVVAGMVVAGRPEALPDAETTVGNFINTLPFVVELRPTTVLSEWFRDIQTESVAAQQFQYLSLAEICAFAGLPAGRPLFDTVLVCENYPNPRPQLLGNVKVSEISYAVKESVPLILEYHSGETLVCRLRYRPDLVNAAVVFESAELLQAAVTFSRHDPLARVADLLSMLRERGIAFRKRRQEQFVADRHKLLQDVAVNRDRKTVVDPGN